MIYYLYKNTRNKNYFLHPVCGIEGASYSIIGLVQIKKQHLNVIKLNHDYSLEYLKEFL